MSLWETHKFSHAWTKALLTLSSVLIQEICTIKKQTENEVYIECLGKIYMSRSSLEPTPTFLLGTIIQYLLTQFVKKHYRTQLQEIMKIDYI